MTAVRELGFAHSYAEDVYFSLSPNRSFGYICVEGKAQAMSDTDIQKEIETLRSINEKRKFVVILEGSIGWQRKYIFNQALRDAMGPEGAFICTGDESLLQSMGVEIMDRGWEPGRPQRNIEDILDQAQPKNATRLSAKTMPVTEVGLLWNPSYPERPDVVMAKDWKGWDEIPVTGFDLSTPLRATEDALDPKPIQKVVSGAEPFREGYDVQLLRSVEGDYYVIDGHHRVAMHKLLRDSTMDAKVVDAHDLQRMGEVDASALDLVYELGHERLEARTVDGRRVGSIRYAQLPSGHVRIENVDADQDVAEALVQELYASYPQSIVFHRQ